MKAKIEKIQRAIPPKTIHKSAQVCEEDALDGSWEVPIRTQGVIIHACLAGASTYENVEYLEPLYVMARRQDRVIASVENSVEVSQKGNIELPSYCMTQQFHFWVFIPHNSKIKGSEISTPGFILALMTIANMEMA